MQLVSDSDNHPELLHNTVGDADAPDEGWWAQEPVYLWSHTYLPDAIIEKLEQDGFATDTDDGG